MHHVRSVNRELKILPVRTLGSREGYGREVFATRSTTSLDQSINHRLTAFSWSFIDGQQAKDKRSEICLMRLQARTV